MSLIFNNKRIGFNGKRLIASKAGEVIIGPDEPDELCPNCGEPWDGIYCENCGYPDNEDPLDPFPGDDPGGIEIG